MPTVLQVGPYSFIFFSSDRGEPAHIHVKRDRQLAKFWLSSVSLAKNRGFKDRELNDIARLVEEHRQTLLEAWHDYFDA
jgi:rRNA maturation protein Rpf1